MAINDIISKTKAEQKEAKLEANKLIQRSQDAEELDKIKAIQNNSQPTDTNEDNTNIDLPLTFKATLGEQKDDSYRAIDKQTEAQIFSNNIDNANAKQVNALEGQQAQETLAAETQNKYNTDIFAPFFSTKQDDYYKRYSQAIKLDKNYDYQSQIGIPLSVKQSNEMSDLKTRLANQKAIATANFIKQQINDDINYIADNYKQYTEAYIEQSKKSGFIYTESFNRKWENAYRIATNKIAEATQTSGPLDNLIRSFQRNFDMVAALGATLSASIREDKLTFKENPVMERLLESMFDYKSFNAHQAYETADLWRGSWGATLRSLPISNGIATLVESSFDILSLGLSAGFATKALNNTVVEARQALLAESILTRDMSKHIDRQIRMAQRAGNDKLLAQLTALKSYMVGPNAKGPLVGELATIGGAVAATFNKSNFFNSIKRYPSHYVVSGAFMANEYAKRAVDLYKDKPDNYQLSFLDAMTPLIHIAVDYAGLVAGLGAKNLFVGAKGSLLNKREMAQLEAKKELTDAEKIRLATLQAENKTRFYDGVLGGIVGAAGVEGVGEMIQTHLEQQVQSGFTLPSLTDMLFNNYKNENLRRKQQEMYMTGALGAIGGVAMAVPAQVGGNLLSSRADQYRYAQEQQQNVSKDVISGNNSEGLTQQDLDALNKNYQNAISRFNAINGNTKSKDDIKAEAEEKIHKISTLKEETEKETEELNKELAQQGHQINTTESVKQNNNSKIQQLEYIKSKLDESSESVKKIEELIKKFKDLDNNVKSMHEAIMMEDIITNEENIADKAKARTALQKLLAFKAEEHTDSTQALRDIEKEVFDSINKTTADVKSLLEFLDTKNQATHLSVDQKIDSEVEENKTPDKNSKKDTDKKSRYDSKGNTNTSTTAAAQTGTNNQQPSNQPQGQTQGQTANANSSTNAQNTNAQTNVNNATNQQTQTSNTNANATQAQQQTNTTNTQNTDNQTRQRDITELTDEEINKMTQKDINDLFSTISPDVGMFIIARTRERNRNTTVSPEENAGYKAMRSMYSVIRVPYSYLEGDREGLTTTIGRSSESVFKFHDKELLLVSKNFYDAESHAIGSVRDDSSIVSPMQRALNSLSSINSETYSGMIQELENLIDNNKSQAEIDAKADEIAKHFRENVTIVGKHMILLNAVISSNPNSPLAKQIRLNANIAAKTLKEIRTKMEKLNKDLNINIEINEEFDNSISGIMDSIHSSTLSIFNRIKTIYRERNSLEPNKEKSNDDFQIEHNKLTKTLKRALKAFQSIAKSLTNLFSNNEFIQTYENTLTLLEQGNSALMANLGFKTDLNVNVNGKTEKIAINGVTNLAEMYFYDILYNTFNIKEYGIDSKMILLDKILSKMFIEDKDGKTTLDINLINTLNYFRNYFEDVKITMPLKISQYANERTARTNSSNVKNITFSLYDLINGNNNVLQALLPDRITELSVGSSLTLDQLIESNKSQLRLELAKILTNENNEIRKEIINRLSIQVAINEPLSNMLDTVLKIGLLSESYTILKSETEHKDDIYHYKNPSNFESTRRAFIRTLLGETEDSDVNNSQAMNALVEMSAFLATSYMESKTMDGENKLMDVITENGNKVIKVHNSLIKELGKHDKESFDSWIRINDNQNEAFNDVKQLIDVFNTFADRVGIRMSDRRAMMLNLQLTGKVLYSSEKGPNGDKQRKRTESIFLKVIGKTIQDAYDEVSKNLYQIDNEGNKVFNTENSISSSRYNSLKNTFIDNLQRDRGIIATYQAIINKIHSGAQLTDSEQNILKETPLVYVPIIVKQYDKSMNQIREEVRYVYSPSLSIMNKQVSDQILVTNTKTNALDTLFALKDSTTITEVLGTIEGRLQSIGYAAFKLFNSYENAKEFPTKYFADKIDYSKATYYLSDLLPNGRIANKIANTEQDNKLLREITNYVLPKKIYEYKRIKDKDGKVKNNLVLVPNQDALQWGGKGISSITADKVSYNGKYSDDYYGLLYSLAMAFGVDFDKIKLKDPKNKTAFNARIKKLNKLHNEILSLENKYKKEQDAVKKAQFIQNLGNKVAQLNNEYIKLFNDYEIDYMYENESLTELLDGLLRDDQTAKDKFKQLWAKREQESINVFTEHPGISIKNGNIFLEAIDSGNFIQNIQTQDLVVYADGKATFSAQNSVRMKGISEIDSLSGITRNNSDVDIKANIGFIKEQAILQDLKKKITTLAINNGDFQNYLKILEEKGIDAYTSAIGPTTLTMRALSHSNTLLTSLYSEELLNRDLIKKPTQAPSYGQWVSSVLAGYIETVKIPFNRTLAEFFDTSSFFNSSILSNGKTVRETMISINNNEVTGQNLDQLKNEIVNAFESALNEEIIKLETKKKNTKLSEFEETKYQLLKGLENYLKDSKTNTLYMLFGKGLKNDKYKGIFNDIKEGKGKVDFTALSNYFFNEETGVLYQDKNTVTKYYENFDVVQVTDKKNKTTKTIKITINMINNANGVVDLINKDHKNRAFFESMKRVWFQGLLNNGAIESNSYFNVTFNDGKLIITATEKLNNEISGIKGELGIAVNDNADIRSILVNTAHFYIASKGSFLPNHKPLAQRANPALAIVQQNNSYIQKQRELIEDNLIIVLDQAMDKILEDAYHKIKGNETKEFNDKAKAELQKAYNNNQTIEDNGKTVYLSDYIRDKKSKVIDKFFREVYGDFWSKSNRNLYIQIFKKHPSLDDKTRFSQMINKQKSIMDNSLEQLLKKKIQIDPNHATTTLAETKSIMSNVIGQFNHPFEALLVIAMNNPTIQVFDAYIGNANNIVRFMNTWNETLASESGANVDSAVILNNFNNSIRESMIESLKANGISAINNMDTEVKESIEKGDTDRILNRVNFLLNVLRHIIQLSSTDNIMANNTVGIHTIKNIDSSSFRQYNKGIFELREKVYKEIKDILQGLEYNGLTELKEELEKRIDYNILNEEDINIKDIKESTDVKDLSHKNSKNFMKLIEKLLKSTLNIVIDRNGANSPINVIRKFVEDNIVKKQVLSRGHKAFYDNRKTALIDINFGSILSDEIINNDIDKIIDIIKKAYPNLDADKISQLILKDGNNMYSINDIVNALLNYDIHLKIDSATNSQTSLDSNLIEDIKSKISYDDLVIKANKIGSTNVKIDGLNITIDIKSTVSKELKYIINIFKTINTMKPNLYKGSLEKLNKDIENNSIRGINTILVNQKSLSGNEVVMGSIHRLTPATATANVLLKLQNSEYETNGIFYNSKISKMYYNLFVSSAQQQINQQHINNYKNNNTQTNQQQANNTTTNANNATNANNVQNNTPNANQQATNAPQQQPTQQQAANNAKPKKQKTKRRRPDSDYILADGDNLPIDNRDDSSKVEQSVQQYQKDMNDDLDSMKQDNKDIAEEITMVTSLINGLIANFKKGIKFFKSGVNSGYRGEYNVDDNEIVIYAGANRGTRAHEFIHAGLTFAFDNVSNETAYLISQISNLHNEVKSYIESIPESERESFIQEIFGDSPNPSARYDYVFGQSTDHNLQEFVSVFLTSPRLIRFLASKEFSEHLTRIPEFKVEAKTRLGKAIKYVPILIGYTFKLIMSRFKEQNRNGLNILTTAVAGLSKYNTEEGQLSEQEAYDRRMVTRTNKAVRSAVLAITKNVEHYINKMKALDPNYNADREVAEIKQELDEKVKSIANDVRQIRALNQIANLRKTGRFVRNIRTGIWLIQSIYYSRLGLRKLMENPIKAQIVANVMQELRQAAVEGTLLDTRIQMDFGISTTKFLKNFVNSVNRALGFRTELDMQKEVAASNISKQVGIILGKPKYIAERIANDTKDKQFYKAYSEGANKIIVHQNLGDYFFGDEMVNQDELNTLVDFAMVDNEETNQRIVETRNAKVASAIRALGFEENSDHHKAIAKIVDSMGITRVTDKKNSLGSQNIEQMLRELGVDFKNSNIKSALKELHQAITLSAILAPRIYNRADFEYIKDKTHTFRSVYANSNLKDKDRAEIRESIKELITLHKSKLDGLYKQRQLKFKDKGVQALINKTKLDDMYYTDMSEMYEEVSAFEYMTDAAYYSDSYKPSEYNQSVTIVNLDPTSENFQEQKDALLKKGFKMENRSQLTGIETFKYDGLINLNNGKDRRGFMYRANTHKGNVIQYLSEEDVNEMKVEAREKYKQNRPSQILNYGKDYTFDGHYIFDNKEFYELGDTKSFAGSETMTRDNISVKQLEEWTGMDTSIESAFRSMERTIQNNIVRNMNNNLIWQQVLLANEEIERRESEGVNHHSEVLFRIGADENGEVRVTFNHSLKEFYGFELTRQDEADFAKFYKAMNNGNLPVNSTIKIDSRMVGMLFGYDLPTFTKSVENDPIKFKIGRAIESATRFLVKESRNNTIIRNPALVWENLKSNIIGLVGEGVPFTEIMKVFPYYVNQLNKYHKDMKDKVRIANEIVIKEKQEYRDKAGITAEQQKREVDKLKRQLEIIDEDLKKNAVAPLMGQGLYTNIVEDAETQGFKWDQKLLELVDKTDKLSKEQIAYLNELFMTESSDAYQTLAYLTRIGDFIPRVILYHHIMGKGREKINGKLETKEQTHRRALDEARDRFINYNTPMWSPVLRKLDRFGFTNYAKYAFSVEKQIAKVFVKAPVQATAIVGMQLGLDAMGVSSVLKPSAYLTESFIFDHKLPSGFINPFTPTDTFVDSLNRWNYVTPNLKF